MTERGSSHGDSLSRIGCKHCLSVVLALLCVLGSSLGCSTKRNDGGTRFYHNLTTRYNVYYNGQLAFDEGYKALYKDLSESYTELLVLDPITRTPHQEESEEGSVGGSLGRAIEKGQKAIREHSIRTKPKISREDLLRDPKKKAFYNKTEYNTFLHKAWMLVAESQFYAGHFMESMATFSYISRLYATDPRVRDEARIGQARCYTAMNWIIEAREILNDLPEDGYYKEHSDAYPIAQAELALKEQDTTAAITYLRTVISRRPIKTQRARLHYLLGQLYSASGQWTEAHQSFGRTIRLSPPYPLEFAATMRQLEIESRSNPKSIINQLDLLARRDKNKDLIDQIYLTQGQLYLESADTTNAIKSFTYGVNKSTQRSFDYMLCLLHLGEIYLSQSNYLKAQEAYAGASAVIDKSHPRYDVVTKLSTDLDQLVSLAEQLHEQDSLRYIASLPESKRLAHVDSLIIAYKKQLEEERNQALLAEQQSKNEVLNQQSDSNTPGRQSSQSGNSRQPSTVGGGNGKSYFYNPTLVSQGKDLFERKWGKRPLADNWRRRNKQITFNANEPIESGSIDDANGANHLMAQSTSTKDNQQDSPDSIPADQDPLQRAYYLAKLPTTPEQISTSDEIIQTALLGMAKAFNEQMELLEESIHTYEDLLMRYPDYSDRATIYYTLYILYQRLERPSLAEPWRGKLLSELPNDPLAVTLQDPNYISKLRANIGADERLYSKALEAYLQGQAHIVQQLYKEATKEYPLSETLPQFAFVNALSYVLQGDEPAFRENLRTLTSSYPKEQVSLLAQEMLRHLIQGGHIAQGGYQGIAWDLHLNTPKDSISGLSLADKPFEVGSKGDKYQALLIVPRRGQALENSLRFAVESFNYAQFTDYILPVSSASSDHETLMTIDDLPSARVAWQYLTKAYSPQGYLSAMDSNSLLLVMTSGNYQLIASGTKSIGDYITFVADSLLELYPATHYMLDQWVIISEAKSDQTSLVETTATGTASPVETPITFEIDRSGISLDPTESQRDSLAISLTDSVPPIARGVTINQPRPITPGDIKKMEQERKAREQQAARDRSVQLKEREKQRQAELDSRHQERRRQEQKRQKQIAQVEAERRAQEKARKEQLRQQEKERQQQLKQLEEERQRKLKSRQP